jgi:hypothetical protein
MKIVISIKSNGIHEYAEMNVRDLNKECNFPIKKLEKIIEQYNKKMIKLA